MSSIFPPQGSSNAAKPHLLERCFTLVIVVLLQACVVVPRTTTVYDEECRVHARQMVLAIEQVGFFGGCANQGCVALLVGAGVVTAATAVVSGSIAVAGNIVYWFERQGQCANH
jgi:hypothetical protein